MAGKNTAAFGIYPNETALENGISALQQAGYRNEDISVLFPENEGTKDFAHRKGTKAPEGAASGAGTGAVAGGVLGWLAGIGAIAIPGVRPLIAAGPICSISLKGPTRFQRRGPLKSAERSDEAILTVYTEPPWFFNGDFFSVSFSL